MYAMQEVRCGLAARRGPLESRIARYSFVDAWRTVPCRCHGRVAWSRASLQAAASRTDVTQSLQPVVLPCLRSNPYIWWPQHILSHHQYTNDDALDVDLHHLRPSRLHPGIEADEAVSGFNFIFKGGVT